MTFQSAGLACGFQGRVSNPIYGIIHPLSTLLKGKTLTAATPTQGKEDQLCFMGKQTEAQCSIRRQNRRGLGAWRLIWVLSILHAGCVTLDELISLPLVVFNKSSHQW